MMFMIHIAATAAGAPIAENDPWTAVLLALLISLGLGCAALMAMALNRSLTRGWIRFHRMRSPASVDGCWAAEDVAEGLAGD